MGEWKGNRGVVSERNKRGFVRGCEHRITAQSYNIPFIIRLKHIFCADIVRKNLAEYAFELPCLHTGQMFVLCDRLVDVLIGQLSAHS